MAVACETTWDHLVYLKKYESHSNANWTYLYFAEQMLQW